MNLTNFVGYTIYGINLSILFYFLCSFAWEYIQLSRRIKKIRSSLEMKIETFLNQRIQLLIKIGLTIMTIVLFTVLQAIISY